MGYTFNAIEIEGVIAARQIIAGSKDENVSLLGYTTEPSEFSYDAWMIMADMVLSSEQSNK